jgi:hypothetical protein
MAKQSGASGDGASFGVEFAPALDSEPVYERPAEARWEQIVEPEPFAPFLPTAAGSWADTRSVYDVGSAPGPGFLDPGSHALLNHVAPMMASDSFHAGALSGASSDLMSSSPLSIYGGDGGDDGDDKGKRNSSSNSKTRPPSR